MAAADTAILDKTWELCLVDLLPGAELDQIKVVADFLVKLVATPRKAVGLTAEDLSSQESFKALSLEQRAVMRRGVAAVQVVGEPSAAEKSFPVTKKRRVMSTLEALAEVEQKSFMLDPQWLETNIMTDDAFDGRRGDLFIPEDMKGTFHARNEEGRHIGPVFKHKSLVLMGPQGVGKTDLYNRLTGSQEASGGGLKTCTVKVSKEFARGPAEDLVVVDTPGTGAEAGEAMTVPEAMELRKALIHGTVGTIALVVNMGTTHRVNELAQKFADGIDTILDCECFKQDAEGNQLSQLELCTPRRTRVFLVLTFRDKAGMRRVEYRQAIEIMRKKFTFIGPVALIDKNVSIKWLYSTLVASAGYQTQCNNQYSIPLVEMFQQFPMRFNAVPDDFIPKIEDGKEELSAGCKAVRQHIEKVLSEETLAGPHDVEHVAPTLDALIRFVDDLYDQVTMTTLAKCYNVKTDDLWADTDVEILNAKVNSLNLIKHQLARSMKFTRNYIAERYPDGHGDAFAGAIFKRCRDCGAIYQKPAGCMWLGTCGIGSVKKNAGHQTILDHSFRYEWKDGKLTLFEGKPSTMETLAWSLRNGFRAAARLLPIYQVAEEDEDPVETSKPTAASKSMEEIAKFYGCGRNLDWPGMEPVPKKELMILGIIPGGKVDKFIESREPAQDMAGMSINSFLSTCGDHYQVYNDIFEQSEVTTIGDLVRSGDASQVHECLLGMGIPRIHVNVIVNRVKHLLTA